MIITEQQLYDYMFCPAKYDLKYEKGIDIAEPKSLNHLLNKVAKYFYINLFNEKILDLSSIKKKWDKLCEDNLDFINSKKNIDGFYLLKIMYEWARKDQLYIVDIDSQYRIIIDDVELIGNMKPIRGTKNNTIELLDTDFNSRVQDQIDVDMKLKYTIDSYAFKELYHKDIDGIVVHNVKHDNNMMTRRCEPDYERMKSTITGIASGIKNKAFYPREQVLCKNCTSREYCKYWHK